MLWYRYGSTQVEKNPQRFPCWEQAPFSGENRWKVEIVTRRLAVARMSQHANSFVKSARSFCRQSVKQGGSRARLSVWQAGRKASRDVVSLYSVSPALERLLSMAAGFFPALISSTKYSSKLYILFRRGRAPRRRWAWPTSLTRFLSDIPSGCCDAEANTAS